ncbi:hypothetical protein [Cyanobium sp. ATX 6F1]|uniref:hypothetical protein n=1 Tax=unclassified Cyanobium TaxID=2627006 RepID=UPI0020CEC6DD|nr:hypothetical protein [Cyanobium sp. ATX 6F1]MCP9915253.1 hypothetical protein [Cyanobium sp. ATX 6F1]
MSIHLLLISREERPSFSFSRLRLVIAPTPELDLATLSWMIDCPAKAIEFTRVGPVELAHGGQWAKRRQLDSLRWPFLDQPVIHGRAIGLRMGARWPGESACHEPFAMRPLTEWEGRNALRWLRDEAQPLSPLLCPVDQAFAGSICHPLLVEYRAADQAGKLAIRLRVLAERKAAADLLKPKIEAQIAADRIKYPVGAWMAQQKVGMQELSRR